ncbi:PREDICTED: F-box protein At5g39450 [Tarenaya hassleriana]|uniref:F-box protein At5g39450 n=1 Tax=Tarenaya hassleriana TaxID=28532 RepID=UPI00053C6C79|nr:PREDICTED: F-box protein At5g39450 [Tarenaya hassleriana]XP_010547877.1 PREDICTED: F-box protein At5g39450 [Tarenaya hassleriana]
MKVGDVSSESSCAPPSLLLSLHDDVFAIISRSLSPRDICNLSLCCKSLCALVASDKIWLSQCEAVGVLSLREVVDWGIGISSYKSLCRFLVKVKPLIGIWVHQNPELGNVVYVMPGFLSVVGCRIIPQEVGPLGIHEGPILWAPVFEIISGFDGSTGFFLHGRENERCCLYPGSIKAIEKNCNILLLEVEPKRQRDWDQLLHCKSCAPHSEREASGKVCRSDSVLSRSQRAAFGKNDSRVPFSKLAFSDRRKLLERVTSHVGLLVPDSLSGPLFPRSRDDVENFQRDKLMLLERRSALLKMQKFGGSWNIMNLEDELHYDPTQVYGNVIRKDFDNGGGFPRSHNSNDESLVQSTGRKSFSGYFRNSIKNILGKSTSSNGNHGHGTSKNTSSSSEIRYANLHDFLSSGESVGLSLEASTTKLSSYRAWPNMHDSRFALYKLPIRLPRDDQEYAGLWGGTFGWPPGKPSEDKPGKALFLLLLSYEESQGERLLIATKILEGTHYVLHPNGSAMFIVNIDMPSPEPFPWDIDGDSLPVIVEHAFSGEGIANGYGFRYPGAKPGTLFVTDNGLLAFIWKESRAVLTLQRLDLQELLKKGDRLQPLPPILNFTYLTKSYSNVFTGYANSSSPRQRTSLETRPSK